MPNHDYSTFANVSLLGQMNGLQLFMWFVLLIIAAYWAGRIDQWFKRWF